MRFRQLYLIILDAVSVNLAAIAGLYLRFEGNIPASHLAAYEKAAPWLTIISLLMFFSLGLYSWILRYAGVDEMMASLAGCGLSTISYWLMLRLIIQPNYPRSCIVISGVVLVILLVGLRLSVRLFIRFTHNVSRFFEHGDIIHVLIVGAGDAGFLLAKEFSKPNGTRRKIVGYIDDDKDKHGLNILGAKVLGGKARIPVFVKKYKVQEVIIAMPSAPPEVIKEIIAKCEGLGVRLRSLPRLSDLAGKPLALNMVRDIELEDLLGRPEVLLDRDSIISFVKGKRVLVTGAGGSIGSEICRQVSQLEPESLILLGHGENSIFEIKWMLDSRFPDVPVRAVIADVRDSAKIRDIFAVTKPEIVFHAAAHKHVPLMEDNVTEALKTNIFGTLNVARAAYTYGAEKFVMISTDKAVNPTSIMGVSKRVAEMVVQSMGLNVTPTAFVSVRFGNVLGSRGSVVPIFREQIKKGGPVTVTHPEMKRYFMTIREAVQLVLQAGAMGTGGEIFILDMGKPVKIVDLAKHMIQLSGKIPEEDIPIIFTGMRKGEKLFEELLTAEEGTCATHHSKIFVARQSPFSLSQFQKNISLLECLLFPYEYPYRVFSSAGAGVAEGYSANGDEDGLDKGHVRNEIILTQDETASAAGNGDLHWIWGSGRDELVLMSRKGDLTKVLKDLVPSYSPSSREESATED